MKAEIEYRLGQDSSCGFVYTPQTRMLFAPKHTATRKEEDKSSSDMVLCAANGHWAEPSKASFDACRDELAKAYPDRKIFADTAAGLVLIYQP